MKKYTHKQLRSVMAPHEKLISPKGSKTAFGDEIRAEKIYAQRLDDENRKASRCRLC
jgi:hypothetical protein